MPPSFRTKANGRVESLPTGMRSAEGEEWEDSTRSLVLNVLGLKYLWLSYMGSKVAPGYKMAMSIRGQGKESRSKVFFWKSFASRYLCGSFLYPLLVIRVLPQKSISLAPMQSGESMCYSGKCPSNLTMKILPGSLDYTLSFSYL